jgi:hypothetical protein
VSEKWSSVQDMVDCTAVFLCTCKTGERIVYSNRVYGRMVFYIEICPVHRKVVKCIERWSSGWDNGRVYERIVNGQVYWKMV